MYFDQLVRIINSRCEKTDVRADSITAESFVLSVTERSQIGDPLQVCI